MADVSRSHSRCATPVGGISSAVTNSYGMTLDREWSERVATLALIGKVTKHSIDPIVTKRPRVLLQTDPAEPTVDVQVRSPALLSAAVFENGSVMVARRIPRGFLNQSWIRHVDANHSTAA